MENKRNKRVLGRNGLDISRKKSKEIFVFSTFSFPATGESKSTVFSRREFPHICFVNWKSFVTSWPSTKLLSVPDKHKLFPSFPYIYSIFSPSRVNASPPRSLSLTSLPCLVLSSRWFLFLLVSFLTSLTSLTSLTPHSIEPPFSTRIIFTMDRWLCFISFRFILHARPPWNTIYSITSSTAAAFTEIVRPCRCNGISKSRRDKIRPRIIRTPFQYILLYKLFACSYANAA